jgi:hypothetical protein
MGGVEGKVGFNLYVIAGENLDRISFYVHRAYRGAGRATYAFLFFAAYDLFRFRRKGIITTNGKIFEVCDAPPIGSK